jgi:hypothetical protein
MSMINLKIIEWTKKLRASEFCLGGWASESLLANARLHWLHFSIPFHASHIVNFKLETVDGNGV